MRIWKERLRLELKKTLSEYEGVSVMVTHDRDEAFQLSDHLLLMEEGRVIAAGETKRCLQIRGRGRRPG